MGAMVWKHKHKTHTNTYTRKLFALEHFLNNARTHTHIWIYVYIYIYIFIVFWVVWSALAWVWVVEDVKSICSDPCCLVEVPLPVQVQHGFYSRENHIIHTEYLKLSPAGTQMDYICKDIVLSTTHWCLTALKWYRHYAVLWFSH